MFDTIASTTVTLLRARGLTATIEFPGYLRLSLPGEAELAVGTANGPWGFDVLHNGRVLDEAGDRVGGLWRAIESSGPHGMEPPRLADAIEKTMLALCAPRCARIAQRVVENACPMVDPTRAVKEGEPTLSSIWTLRHGRLIADVIDRTFEIANARLPTGGYGDSDTSDLPHLLHLVTVAASAYQKPQTEASPKRLRGWLDRVELIAAALPLKHDDDLMAREELRLFLRLWHDVLNRQAVRWDDLEVAVLASLLQSVAPESLPDGIADRGRNRIATHRASLGPAQEGDDEIAF